MSLTVGEWFAAIAAGATIATTLFHVGVYIGRLTLRVERVEGRLNEHEGLLKKWV